LWIFSFEPEKRAVGVEFDLVQENQYFLLPAIFSEQLIFFKYESHKHYLWTFSFEPEKRVTGMEFDLVQRSQYFLLPATSPSFGEPVYSRS
ncbi:hypothetical protein D918_06212, partial [Trichuris suis]